MNKYGFTFRLIYLKRNARIQKNDGQVLLVVIFQFSEGLKQVLLPFRFPHLSLTMLLLIPVDSQLENRID